MPRRVSSVLSASGLCALGLACASSPPAPQERGTETYKLENGLTVTLLPDRILPQVTINTWFGVGSKDEAPGRTGFAHLFEHLMFMGTKRVPGNQFDVLMETGGGSNNASTSEDRTNYFSMGPSSLLPTLLWLDAYRLATLDEAMTKEKVDLQRDGVRNERRQSYIPLGRFGLPSDCAGCAVFLATELSAWVTGTTIHVDGGALAAAGFYRTPNGHWTNTPVVVDSGFPAGGRGRRPRLKGRQLGTLVLH